MEHLLNFMIFYEQKGVSWQKFSEIKSLVCGDINIDADFAGHQINNFKTTSSIYPKVTDTARSDFTSTTFVTKYQSQLHVF